MNGQAVRVAQMMPFLEHGAPALFRADSRRAITPSSAHVEITAIVRYTIGSAAG